MVSHHLLDSLAILPHLGTGPWRMADVGSGGGLPGIPVAIAQPSWQMTLLDSNSKKAAFLAQACAELRIVNATAVQARVEAFQPAQPFDVAVSRAYATLAQFVADAAHLLAPGGRLVAMKGALPADELREVTAGARVRVTSTSALHVPGLDAERHLIVMEPA
jgi:16S rRNA (guanine527-N7)-methyltransferase